MHLDMFRKILDRLAWSGAKEVRFLGGEPSLHPAFVEMVAEALKMKLRTVIFTNGIISSAALDELYDLRCHNLLMVLNTAAMAGAGKHRFVREQFLKKLASHIMPGITIAHRGQNLNPVLDFIETHGLVRSVRLGIAHPAPGAGNKYLHPKFYREISTSIMCFLESAHSRHIGVEFDCGFVPCMFDGISNGKEALLPTDLGCRCNPLPDFLPDGSAIACFPLATEGSISLEVGKSVSDYRTELSNLLVRFKDISIFPYCSACYKKKEGLCLGGCKAAALRRLVRPSWVDASNRAPNVHSCIINEMEGKPVNATLPAHSSPISDTTRQKPQWVIPYIDQPISFWERITDEYGPFIKEVYFPLPNELFIGSGQPLQPQAHLCEFLQFTRLSRSVTVNPIVLSGPVERCASGIIRHLQELSDTAGITGVTVSNLHLAEAIRKELPELRLTASVLLDIFTPLQAKMIEGVFDVIVPASRIMRDRNAIERLRKSSRCGLRLIVNEACIPGCPFRTQHFYEMCSGTPMPRSLCDGLLEQKPWLRLTGAWVLPQHLHLFERLFDELKLAGRVTLRQPKTYFKVLDAYVKRSHLFPNQIGGGPASVLEPREIDERFFEATLTCNKDCDKCDICRDYYLLPLTNSTKTVDKEG
jgi:hypothetical protein